MIVSAARIVVPNWATACRSLWVESGVEAGGERLRLVLAGLALVQPGLVVVIDGEGGQPFVDFVDAGHGHP